MHDASSEGTFRVPVSISVAAAARIERLDGSRTGQRFVRLKPGDRIANAWLLNPCSNELHRCLESDSDGIVIDAHGPLRVAWGDAVETLLLVEAV